MKLNSIFFMFFFVLFTDVTSAMTEEQIDEKVGLLREHYGKVLSAELPEELLKPYEDRLKSGEKWGSVFSDFKTFTLKRGSASTKDCEVSVHEALTKAGVSEQQKNFDNKKLAVVNGKSESVWNSRTDVPTSVVDIHCQEGNPMAEWADATTWGQKSDDRCSENVMLHDFMDKLGLSSVKSHFKNVSLANLASDSRSPASLTQDEGWMLEIRCHKKKLHFVRLVQP